MQRPPHGATRIAASLSIAAAVGVGALGWITASSARAAHSITLAHLAHEAEAAHPNALWHVVHGLCVRDMKISGHPAPCAEVDLGVGYAVIKDFQAKTQYLLVPTTRVTGIESPELLTPESPNYWQAAWSARRLIEKRIGRPIPRDAIGLAVNSIYSRTQNQLHIHIDCVRSDVRSALEAQHFEIGARWSTMTVSLAGRSYQARWIPGAELNHNDPFKLLADGDPIARADMGHETLVLIGAVAGDGTPGFVLLSDRVDLATNDIGEGERLLDHHCAVLSKPAND